MAAAENRLGVPPPKNTATMRRPHTAGSATSRSAVKAPTYSASGISPRRSCELKSQYGHFLRHHGMWIYSASGGSAAKRGESNPESTAVLIVTHRDESTTLAWPCPGARARFFFPAEARRR